MIANVSVLCSFSLLCLTFQSIWISAVSALEEPCPSSYPKACKCYPKSKGVSCENLNSVAEFPRVFNNDTKWLSLQNTKIENITKVDLKGLPELVELAIRKSSLKSIEEGSFQQLPNLAKIYLSENRLDTDSFQNNTFANLTNLKEVRLDGNPITRLPDDIFKNSPVESLNMKNTQLNAQGLKSIGDGRVAKSLKTLYLHGTSLQRLNDNQFSGLPNLKDINLQNCNIEYINKNFVEGTKITHIDLYENPIVKINADAMQGDQIVDFACRYCGLTSDKVFGEESFFLKMTSLKRLDLGHNEINHVPKDAFKGMTKLETLLLFHNNISSIDENPFRSLPSPSSMGIQNNPFNCDCNLAWFHKYAVRNLDEHVVKDMKCASPSNLSGKAFNDLKDSQFCCKATANKTAVCGITCTTNCNSTNVHNGTNAQTSSFLSYFNMILLIFTRFVLV